MYMYIYTVHSVAKVYLVCGRVYNNVYAWLFTC